MTVRDQENLLPSTWFSTRFFLPSWWVRAYEVAAAEVSDQTETMGLSWRMGLTPALDLDELNALAVILAILQEQLLTRKNPQLILRPADFQKHVNTKNKHKLSSYARVLQGIVGLRLLVDSPEGFDLQPIFCREKWLKSPSSTDHFELSIGLSELGADVLLGVTNPYLELLREVQRQPTALRLIGEQAPLEVWRSVWMELSGLEQALFMRLEKAMQWEYRWLHFDGIFGKSIESLVEGLSLKSATRPVKADSDFFAALVTLERLTVKLVHQGLIKSHVDDEFLALSPSEQDSNLLIWQATPERVFASDRQDYLAACQRYFVQVDLNKQIDTLVSFLAANLENIALVSKLKTLWNILLTSKSANDTILGETNAAPLPILPLYIEWCARQEPGHKFPLPTVFTDTPLARLANLRNGTDIVGTFEAFAEMLSSNSEYQSALLKVPLASLAWKASIANTEVGSHIKGWQNRYRPQALREIPQPTLTSAPAVAAIQEPMEEQRTDKKQFSSENMKRLATEELAKIKKSDPETYQSLKQGYLDSLDEAKRKMIVDVQKRMQPELFDNHLKHSLVKFMIENPGTWRSVKSQEIKIPYYVKARAPAAPTKTDESIFGKPIVN
jgi:hypothetical protein